MKSLMMGVIVACALLAMPHANAQTLEEQLRSQLADARGQLQDLQGQQAQWQAQKAQLEKERDDARKALDAAKAELSKGESSSKQYESALTAAHNADEQAQAKVQALQKAIAAADAQSHSQEVRDNDLSTQLTQAQGQVTTCTAKNKQLYQIGNEILDAYSHMTIRSVVASREPFAATERVKLENAAQAYGDRLYEQRYDPRAVNVKKP